MSKPNFENNLRIDSIKEFHIMLSFTHGEFRLFPLSWWSSHGLGLVQEAFFSLDPFAGVGRWGLWLQVKRQGRRGTEDLPERCVCTSRCVPRPRRAGSQTRTRNTTHQDSTHPLRSHGRGPRPSLEVDNPMSRRGSGVGYWAHALTIQSQQSSTHPVDQ